MAPLSTAKKARESGGGAKRMRSGAGASSSTATSAGAASRAAAVASAGPSHAGGRRAAGAGAGAGTGAGQGRRGPFVYRNEFRRDVEGLMYAFGDNKNPDADAVAVMEDMTVAFLIDLCRRARPAPNQMAAPANSQYITRLATDASQQRAIESEQQAVDDAAERAAAGSSASAKARAQRRTAVAAVAEQHRRETEMAVRPGVHPFVGRSRMTVEDVKFACRKDAKMTSRIEELIYLDKEISSARRMIDVPVEETAAAQDAAKNSSRPATTAPAAATTVGVPASTKAAAT